MDQIKSFDLLVFRGNELSSNFISKAQEFILGSGSWTHVGIAMRDDVFKGLIPGKVYIWESTFTNKMSGVQLRDLSNVIKRYKGHVGYCHLIDNPVMKRKDETEDIYRHRIAEIQQKILEKFNECEPVTYACGPCSLISALCAPCRLFRTKDSGKFCSQFAGELYQKIGIIPENLDPRNMVPMDFLGFDKDGMKCYFENPVIIGSNTCFVPS